MTASAHDIVFYKPHLSGICKNCGSRQFSEPCPYVSDMVLAGREKNFVELKKAEIALKELEVEQQKTAVEREKVTAALRANMVSAAYLIVFLAVVYFGIDSIKVTIASAGEGITNQLAMVRNQVQEMAAACKSFRGVASLLNRLLH